MDEMTFVEAAAGAGFPMTFPVVFREIVWRTFAQLPSVQREQESRRQRDVRLQPERAYQQHLEGRTVRSVAEAATIFLVREATSL